MEGKKPVKVEAVPMESPISHLPAFNAHDQIAVEQFRVLNDIYAKLCEIAEKLDSVLKD